ncbi:MAG: GNAT family N-acetyltransferase [Actinomycetes bacterium]
MTHTPLVVREARPDEWQAAGELAVRAYRAGGHDAIDNGYLEVVLDAAARAIPGPLLVALRDEVIVGTGTVCAPGTSHAELCLGDEREFRFLAVEPDAWGTGVAAALLDTIEEHAREAGAQQLVCCVITWNEPAHRLYVARGYQRIPERDWLPIPEVRLFAYALPLA